MFHGLWPGFDADEVPITSVTNGVHAPTWVAREVVELAEQNGSDADADDGDATGRPSTRSPTTRSGRCSVELRERLVARRPAAAAQVLAAARRRRRPSSAGSTSVLDPDVLTIGFARRVPSYKRLTLMLRDPERLQARCCSTRSGRCRS